MSTREPLDLIRNIASGFRYCDRDEMVSAGLVGYAKALRHFDGRGEFDGYAALRVRHEMLDALRSWYHVTNHELRPAVQELPLYLVDPSESVEDRLCREGEVEDAMRALPPSLKRLVEFRLRGLRVVDIAAIVGMSSAWVSQRLSVALARMKARQL